MEALGWTVEELRLLHRGTALASQRLVELAEGGRVELGLLRSEAAKQDGFEVGFEFSKTLVDLKMYLLAFMLNTKHMVSWVCVCVRVCVFEGLKTGNESKPHIFEDVPILRQTWQSGLKVSGLFWKDIKNSPIVRITKGQVSLRSFVRPQSLPDIQWSTRVE